MKIVVIIGIILTVCYWWMIWDVMDYDPSWDEPLQKEDIKNHDDTG